MYVYGNISSGRSSFRSPILLHSISSNQQNRMSNEMLNVCVVALPCLFICVEQASMNGLQMENVSSRSIAIRHIHIVAALKSRHIYRCSTHCPINICEQSRVWFFFTLYICIYIKPTLQFAIRAVNRQIFDAGNMTFSA